MEQDQVCGLSFIKRLRLFDLDWWLLKMLEDYLVQQPTAIWNSARGVWERAGMANLLCEHWELFSVTWPTSGMTQGGRVFGLPMLERLTVGSESSLLPIPEESMLRTPSAIEGQGGAISEDKARERNRMLQVRDQMAQLAAENGLKVSDAIAGQLLPTLKARDSQPEGYEAGLRRSQPQLGTIVKGIVDSDERVVSELLPTPRAQEPGSTSPGYGDSLNDFASRVTKGYARKDLLPTPALGHIRNYDEPVEDYLERRQKFEDGEYRGMPGVSLGVAVRMEMLPTPNTMEHREIKTPEQIAALKEKSPGGYRNLRESVINDLLPTPIVRDYKDGSAAQERDGKISTDTVARAVFNSGEVTDISWGKFEPAIRRWEEVLGRPAPEPTKPDGKDGSHRLSSRFTEWMMGLPDGWITDVGLNRVDELKACGNGVVPQQAELALRILLQGIDYEPANNDVNLPTPTVSDVYTSSLTSSQQKEGSMHSVTLPQAVERIIVQASDKIKG